LIVFSYFIWPCSTINKPSCIQFQTHRNTYSVYPYSLVILTWYQSQVLKLSREVGSQYDLKAFSILFWYNYYTNKFKKAQSILWCSQIVVLKFNVLSCAVKSFCVVHCLTCHCRPPRAAPVSRFSAKYCQIPNQRLPIYQSVESMCHQDLSRTLTCHHKFLWNFHHCHTPHACHVHLCTPCVDDFVKCFANAMRCLHTRHAPLHVPL
jgi:hypothetical protein